MKFFNSQAREIVRILNDFVKKSPSEEKAFQISILQSLIARNLPRFTCGLFEFDWKLALTTISAATTNFIILIQFELASSGNKNN